MPSSYALGPHFEALMERLIASGRYNSKSEILREGLRVVEEREAEREARLEQLRTGIERGMASGPGIPVDKVFDRLEAKYLAMIEREETE